MFRSNLRLISYQALISPQLNKPHTTRPSKAQLNKPFLAHLINVRVSAGRQAGRRNEGKKNAEGQPGGSHAHPLGRQAFRVHRSQAQVCRSLWWKGNEKEKVVPLLDTCPSAKRMNQSVGVSFAGPTQQTIF